MRTADATIRSADEIAMGRLTTHVLDTARGRPAAGLAIELFRTGQATEHLKSAITNDDGRLDEPLLEGDAFRPGRYELLFAVGDYFGAGPDADTFLDVIPVRFRIANAGEHYHVPLLVSPYGYTTYRGS